MSETAAQCSGCEPSPKVDVEDPQRLWPAQLGWLKEPQKACPGMQNCAGVVAVEVGVPDLVDERHRRVPDAAPVERVADLVGVERRRQRPVGRADQDEHRGGLVGGLVGDLLAVGVVHRRRPDVDVDDVAGVHHERAGAGSVREHAVERRRLDDVARPFGRASRPASRRCRCPAGARRRSRPRRVQRRTSESG